MKNPKISVLVSARRNSKYLAKFIMGFMARTRNSIDTELLIMTNVHDSWNLELKEIYKNTFKWFTEDYQLGRAGLHEYFNAMIKEATGDWIIYFCEDHFIMMDSWDQYVRKLIIEQELNSKDILCLIPKFDNCGAMNQILSRGYVEGLGGVIGNHGWIDSYINDVNSFLPDERIIRFDDEMFHDFTHDNPSPMDDSHSQGIIGPAASKLPRYKSEIVKQLIRQDAKKLNEKIRVGY